MKVSKIMNKLLWPYKFMEYLAYVIVFLVPLYFDSPTKLFAFTTPKILLTISIILIMIVLYSIGVLLENKVSFKITLVHLFIFLFISILTISSIFGVDPHNSFFGDWRLGNSLLLIYFLTIFAFLLGFLIKKNKVFLFRFLSVSFIASICVAIISYFGDYLFPILKNNNSSTIGNNSYVGAYLLFNILFGIGLFFYYSKIWKKILIAMGVIFVTLSPIFFNIDILLGKISTIEIIRNPFLLLGDANAATIGLITSFLIIGVLFLIFSSKKILKITGVVLFIGLLSGILFTGFNLVNPDSSLHQTYLNTKGENRFIAWDAAQISFWEHPILGSGFNNFYYNYQKHFSTDVFKVKTPEFYFYQPHNVIWEYASNNGVLGLMSFLLLLFFVFLSFFSSRSDETKKDIALRIVMIGVLFGYFIQNLFGFDTPVTYLMLFVIFGVAIGLSKNGKIFEFQYKRKIWVDIISGLIIASMLASIIIFVILPVKEFKEWRKFSVTMNIRERIALREKMQDISVFGGISDSSYLAGEFLNKYKENLSAINDNNKVLYLEEIQSIIDQLDKEIERQPYDIRSHLIASQFLNIKLFINKKADEKTWNESYNYIQKALSINPNNLDIYIMLSRSYIIKGDFKNAQLSIKKAIEIDPEYIKLYDQAKVLLKIYPDKVFEKYINEMEKKWLITN